MMNAEWKSRSARAARARLYSALCILTSAFLLSACSDNSKPAPTTKPLSLEERNQQALQDPFGYGPKTDPDYLAKHGLDADGKPTLKSDVDKFLNP